MSRTASFEVAVAAQDAQRFAELSGDWNPLHTDADYAKSTSYRQPILHGAFSAGLMSRLAGMHLPGWDCLLHGMRLKFVSPISPPAVLLVKGTLVQKVGDGGVVDVVVSDAKTGQRYVTGGYDFGIHTHAGKAGKADGAEVADASAHDAPVLLVTGATGGIGGALLKILGGRAIGATRGHDGQRGMIAFNGSAQARQLLGNRKLSGIVHCGWPRADNERLVAHADAGSAVSHHIAEPLTQIIELAQLLDSHGIANAPLVLIGSTFAEPGRHHYRSPLYSIAKSTIPTLTKILGLELSIKGRRCVGVVFDILDGGMNGNISPAIKMAHADRVPRGELATTEDAARQIAWLLENQSHLISGAVVTLTGGSIP